MKVLKVKSQNYSKNKKKSEDVQEIHFHQYSFHGLCQTNVIVIQIF